MGTTDFGTQTISFDYKQTGTAQGFNKLNYKLFPKGVYEGGLLTKVNATTVTIATLTIFIEDSAVGLGARIETSISVNLTISEATPIGQPFENQKKEEQSEPSFHIVEKKGLLGIKEQDVHIEDYFKSCKYLENVCKESLSPNEKCNKKCEKELQKLEKELKRKHEKKSENTKKVEPKYLCLKLSKSVDIEQLYDNLKPIVKELREKLHPPYARTDADVGIVFPPQWKDLVEILLKADGSWDKKPELYMKYSVEKIKEDNK